ncbi:MAG TPA: hypothetical protein PKY78_07035 [Candidatus Omnitrophota bacterium]|nr:hypothetical protein [Candidatus Omnitrophota bacterium]HPS20720.1 hypothetical protein [Candidatus Omnitrophota bacterium]
MAKRWIAIIGVCVLLTQAFYAGAEDEASLKGRYEVKNLKVKGYYMNEQGELTRWVDDELLKIDTATGRVWKWVSERSRDKKEMKEYWEELISDTTPMPESGR